MPSFYEELFDHLLRGNTVVLHENAHGGPVCRETVRSKLSSCMAASRRTHEAAGVPFPKRRIELTYLPEDAGGGLQVRFTALPTLHPRFTVIAPAAPSPDSTATE